MRTIIAAVLLIPVMASAGCNRTDVAPNTTPPRVPATRLPSKGTNTDGANVATSPGGDGKAQPGQSRSPERPRDGDYRCLRVRDGNTLELEGVGAVALAGVRAPSVNEAGGAEVLQQVQRAVASGSVSVDFCPANPKNAAGQYRVIVAYRDRSKQMRNLNQLMIMEGLARLDTGEKCHTNLGEWQQYQDYAQQNRKGLWKSVWANQAGGSPAAGRQPGAGVAAGKTTPAPTQPAPPPGGQRTAPGSSTVNPTAAAPPAARPYGATPYGAPGLPRR